MEYEWDEAKRRSNLSKHGVDFVAVTDFLWNTALTRQDLRHGYPETRFESIGLIGERLHVLIWTEPHPAAVRVISLRKADPRERRRYAQADA